MAPCRRRLWLLRSNRSVLVSVWDHDVGYLVFRFDVKRLFDEDDDESKRRSRRREVLPLPRSPVACFRRPLRFPMDLAASAGGDKIVAATTDGHIMVYDTTRSEYTYDHHLCCWKRWPILLALTLSNRPSSSGAAAAERRRRRRDDMSMLVATRRPDLSKPEPSFEALRLTSVGRLQPLPVPPPLVSPPLPANWRCYGYRAQVMSYFVASGRVWLSVGEAGKGTYSLDMAAPNTELGWRREGIWMLPLEGRAVYAPDLGRLLLGFSSELRALCAIDMEARPPVIRQHWAWHTLLPTEVEGYSPQEDYLYYGYGGLSYLGGGRLCISWSSPYRDQGRRMILALTAVELIMSNGPRGELLLRKRRSRCYRLPSKNQKATVLPVL